MSDRIWDTPNQQDPWEAYAEWEAWMADELMQEDEVQRIWAEEISSWWKPHLYGVMCDLHDNLSKEIDSLKLENDEHFKNIQALNDDRLRQANEIERLKEEYDEQGIELVEVKTIIQSVLGLIDKEGDVSKWKIHNWLSQALNLK